jgi:hypothetical protein
MEEQLELVAEELLRFFEKIEGANESEGEQTPGK